MDGYSCSCRRRASWASRTVIGWQWLCGQCAALVAAEMKVVPIEAVVYG